MGKKDVLNPLFWEERINDVRNSEQPDEFRAIFHTHEGIWDTIQKQTKKILADEIKRGSSVLDAGCGIGSLVDCLPDGCSYVGIDFCASFISVAKTNYPSFDFRIMNFDDLYLFEDNQFDVVVLRSIKAMVEDNSDMWPSYAASFIRISKELPLVLEYTSHDKPAYGFRLGAV